MLTARCTHEDIACRSDIYMKDMEDISVCVCIFSQHRNVYNRRSVDHGARYRRFITVDYRMAGAKKKGGKNIKELLKSSRWGGKNHTACDVSLHLEREYLYKYNKPADESFRVEYLHRKLIIPVAADSKQTNHGF